MHSSLNRKPTDDPHDFVVVPADHVQVAPADDEISDLLRAAARQHADVQGGAGPSSPVPPVDTTFRATDVNNDLLKRRWSIGRRVMRALAAVLLAGCIGAAAMAWQASGYAFKKIAWKWLPKAAVTTSLPLEKLGLTSPSSSPSAEPAASEDTPPQTAAAEPAPASAEAQPAISAAQPADPAPSTARDLASVGQEIEALKASIAELKANQQQMARELAKGNEQNARARLTAAPPHPAVAPRKPVPPPYTPSPGAAAPAYRPSATPYPATQAAASPPPPQVAQPYAQRPVETLPPPPNDPGLVTAPRPPMPVQ
jgi:hypothetical protein